MPNSKVEGFKWKEDELIVLVSPHHHLAGRSEVNLKELVAEKWVFREKGSGTRMATGYLALGIRTRDLDIQASGQHRSGGIRGRSPNGPGPGFPACSCAVDPE